MSEYIDDRARNFGSISDWFFDDIQPGCVDGSLKHEATRDEVIGAIIGFSLYFGRFADISARVAELEQTVLERDAQIVGLRCRAALAKREAVAVPNVSIMARTLSDRLADAFGVDRDDWWKVYGNGFIDDVNAMLAASQQAAKP